MQPNEQKQYSQSPTQNPPGYVSPSGADIPGYLNMEPINSSRDHKPHNGLKVILAVLIVLGIAVLVMAGFWWSGGGSERLFNDALKSSLANHAISYTSEVTMGDKIYRSSTGNVNLANNKNPLISIKSERTLEDSEGKEVSVVSETISDGSEKTYFKISDVPNIKELKALKENSWYATSAKNPTKAARTLGGIDQDIIGSVWFGIIPRGNLNNLQLAKWESLLQRIEPYEIIESEKDINSGDNLTKYVIQYDTNKVAELNRELAKSLDYEKVPYSYSQKTDTKSIQRQMVVWIHNDNKVITKVQIRSDSNSSKSKVVSATNYTYPANVTIKAPSESVDL